jgi:hypothetical protein
VAITFNLEIPYYSRHNLLLVIQKKVISPNDFASLDQLSEALPAFVDRYNQTARPFNWKFTASDPSTCSAGSANGNSKLPPSKPIWPRQPDTPDEFTASPT